jgi:hypothetical protein
LLGTGRSAEARRVLAELNSVPEDDGLVDELIEELEFGIRAENEGGKATWIECFSSRNFLWKRTLNGMMLQFIQQLNGQNFYCESQQQLRRFHFLLTVSIRLLRRYFLPKCWYRVRWAIYHALYFANLP